jgi:glutaminase
MTSRVATSPIEQYLRHLHDKFARLEDGTVATYIPELGRARPDWFGIAVATVDGQVYEVGDSRQEFTIQSISKPLVYGLALEAAGLKQVLSKVGVEPSGEAFNSISLDPKTGRPLNPMINAGAIATTSLVPGNSAEERRRRLLELFSEFAARELTIDEAVYSSERDTGHRNRAIAHLLRNSGILTGDPEEPLDLYFRQCSISVTCHDLAVMAATLASGGVNPISKRRVLQTQNTGRLLSVMSSCGMYDYAGEWIYNVGMPAKSGVAGGLLAVLPGQLGIGVFSPPLDAKGNSVRGIRVCNDLSQDFGLHLFNTPRVITPSLKQVRTGAEVRSKRLRVKPELELLRVHGHSIRIYQLRGRLVFASLEPVMRAVLHEAAACTHLILDLAQVADLDRASCRLLLDLRDQLMAARVRVYLTGASEKTTLRNYVVSRLDEGGWKQICRFESRDDALEDCENDLLNQHGGRSRPAGDVPLRNQEICRGLTAGELQDLSDRLTLVEEPAGVEILAAGSDADAMYFLVQGEVGIFLKPAGAEEQLVSRLGPGMSFGEVALVDREPRSATVRALEPIRAQRLSFAAFDLLADEGLGHIQTKIIHNLVSVLAARLRSANTEIRSLG